MVDPLHRALGFTWRAPSASVAAFNGLLGGSSSAPALPPPAPVLPMPDLNDPAILAAKKRAMDATASTGRASTILTGSQGSDYSGSKLGVP